MKKSNLNNSSRRDFITKIVPACAATCLIPGNFPGRLITDEKSISQQAKPNFDQQIKSRLTYRQYFNKRFKEYYIPLMKELSNEIGKERLIEIIKRTSYRLNFELGKRIASRAPNNTLYTLMGGFRNANKNGMLYNSDPWEVVEDTENAFEIKIKDCLTAVVFREEDAADFGFATVCYADYALPQGFNPKIKLVRDKTVMQGHDCCNHRYVWTE